MAAITARQEQPKKIGRTAAQGLGWRMYDAQQGNVLIIMLGGGEKSTQSSDISKAQELAKQLEF